MPVEIDDEPQTVNSFEAEVRDSILTRLLVRHAGLIVTLGYAFLAVVGMVFNFFYFAAFGINVLEYSEPSDFIVAAVQSPVVILLCILPAFVIWLVVLLRRGARRRFARYDAYARRHETKYGRRYNAIFRVTIPLLIVSYAIVFTSTYARFASSRIVHGKGRRVHITRIAPLASDSAARFLVGTTSKYLFFYDTLARSTDIIPAGNVAALTVVLPARSLRK